MTAKSHALARLLVRAGKGGAAVGRAGRDDGVVLLNVEDAGAANGDGLAGARGRDGVGELDLAKVDEGDERLAVLEVLDDPLGVRLAQRGRLAGEGLRDRLARRLVLDDGGAVGGRGRRHDHGDGVAGVDGDVGKRARRGRPPLVHGAVLCHAVLDGEEDARLQDGALAGVAVDADPGGAAVERAGVAAGRHRYGRDDYRRCHAVEVASRDDGAGPVLRVRRPRGGRY